MRKTRDKLKVKIEREPSWAVIGADVSMSSIALAGMMWDSLLQRMRGPEFVIVRWNQGEHYFDRCAAAANGHELVLDLLGMFKGAINDLEEVHIAVEEPWPMGIVKRAQSGWLKQQAQIQGIFLGSLLRYGYRHIYEINNSSWKKIVSQETGISVRDPDFKFAVKDWARKAYGIVGWPDLIRKPGGMVAKPDNSKAKPVQPDDRYDALAIMTWMQLELENQGVIAG